MVSGLQCICGMFVIFHDPVSGRIPCPNCGTEWLEDSVRLFDGTTFYLEENGRWVMGENTPKSVPIAVSRFFGGNE
jgi:hypothetical protein